MRRRPKRPPGTPTAPKRRNSRSRRALPEKANRFYRVNPVEAIFISRRQVSALGRDAHPIPRADYSSYRLKSMNPGMRLPTEALGE